MLDDLINWATRVGGEEGANRIVSAILAEGRKRGIVYEDWGQGSPMAPPDRNVVRARMTKAGRAFDEPAYAPTLGEDEYRAMATSFLSSIISAWQIDLDPDFTPDQVGYVGSGSTGISLAMKLVGQSGRSILSPQPYYSNYPGPIADADALLRFYQARREYGHIPNEDDIMRAFSESEAEVAGLLLNFPNNPTSATLGYEEARELARVIDKMFRKYSDVLIVNDVAYLDTAIEGRNFSFFPFLDKRTQNAVLNVFSGSKGASIHNDRTAPVATINPKIISNVNKLSSKSNMGVNTVGTAGYAEYAYLAGLFRNFRDPTINYYQDRLKLITHGLNKITQQVAGCDVIDGVPGGGIFAWAMFKFLVGQEVKSAALREIIGSPTIRHSKDFFNIMYRLNEVGYLPVGTIYGEGFGAKPDDCYLRLSAITRSLNRIEAGLESFRGALQLITGKDLGAVQNYDSSVELIKREDEERQRKLESGELEDDELIATKETLNRLEVIRKYGSRGLDIHNISNKNGRYW